MKSPATGVGNLAAGINCKSSIKTGMQKGIMITNRFTLLLITLVFAFTCFARPVRWPVSRKPTIALGQAEAIGDKLITEKHKGFFCIGARFEMSSDTSQEWELSYTNPKGERMWMRIDEKGNAELFDTLPIE